MNFKLCLIAPTALLMFLAFAPPVSAQTPPGHAMFVRGGKDLQANHYQSAVSDYTEALRQGDDGWPIYVGRSEAYGELAQQPSGGLGIVVKALTDLKTARSGGILQSQAGQSEYAYALGLSLSVMDRKKAEEALTQAIRLEPPCVRAVFQRGVVRYAMGKRALAIQDMKQAVLLDHQTNDILNERLARQRLAEFQHGGGR